MANMWGPRDQLLVDISQAAQRRIKKNAYAGADAAKAEIEAICRPIAEKFNGRIVTADVKEIGRAGEKVRDDYGGDWYGIKDLARMTLIVPTVYCCYAAMEELKLTFVASRGYGVMGEKYVHAREDPCGYSGLTLVVRTSNGWPGEIQINVPNIIYAKQGERSVKRAIGIHHYMRIKLSYQLEGGMGHKLYEIYRKAPASPAGLHAAAVSRAYYDYFRRMPDLAEAWRVKSALVGLFGPHLGMY